MVSHIVRFAALAACLLLLGGQAHAAIPQGPAKTAKQIEGQISYLEGLLFENTESPSLRLALGVLYYRLKAYHLSRYHLQKVISSPDADIEQKVLARQILEDQANPLHYMDGRLVVGLAAVSHAPTGGGGAVQNLTFDQLDNQDWGGAGFIDFAARYRFRPNGKYGLGLTLTGGGFQSISLSDDDVQVSVLNAGALLTWRNLHFGLLASSLMTEQDDATAWGPVIGARFGKNKGWSGQARLNHQFLIIGTDRPTGLQPQDGNETSGSARVTYGWMIHSLSAGVTAARFEGDEVNEHLDRYSGTLRWGMAFDAGFNPIGKKTRVGLGLTLGHQEGEIGAAKTKLEADWQALELTAKQPFGQGFALQGALGGRLRESNQPVLDNDSLEGRLAIEWQF